MRTVFNNVVRAELLKMRKNAIYPIICVLPIAITLIMIIVYISDEDLPVTDFWKYYGCDVSMFYVLIYPAMMSLAAFANVDMEIKNNANKLLFYLPVNQYKLYLSKYFVFIIYYTLSLVVAYLSFILSAGFLGLIVEEVSLGMVQSDSKNLIDLFFLKTYFLILPVVSFLIFLSYLLPKLWFPTTIAFFMYLLGLIAFQTKYAFLLPNAALVKLAWIDLRKGSIIFWSKDILISCIYTVIFIILGYFAFKRIKYAVAS